MTTRQLHILNFAVLGIFLLPAAAARAATTNDFEGGGTPLSAAQFDAAPAVQIINSGGDNVLRILHQNPGERRFVAFDQTDTLDNLSSITATFDLRAVNTTASTAFGDGFGFGLVSTQRHGISGAPASLTADASPEIWELGESLTIGFQSFDGSFDGRKNVHVLFNGAQFGPTVDSPVDFSHGDSGGVPENTAFDTAVVSVDFSPAGGANVSLALNATPVITNQFVAGFHPQDMRAAYGARTGGAINFLDIDDVDVQFTGSDNAPIPTEVFNFANFSGAGGEFLFTTNTGFAGETGGVLRVGDATANRSTTAWLKGKQLVGLGFDTEFVFDFNAPGGTGADGMAFVLHNNDINTVGLPGTLEDGLSTNALSIGLDSFDNGGEGVSQVEVFANGVSLGVHDPGFDLSGAGAHTLRVAYLPGDLDVFLDGHLILGDLNVNLAALGAVDANGLAFLGFTSRTGGAFENHDVLSWSLNAIPEPSAFALSLLALVGLAGIGWRRRRG